MTIGLQAGDKVEFTGVGCEEQVKWGNHTDPRKNNLLVVGEVYTIERVEVHSWHTKIFLKGIEGQFNSLWFSFMEEEKEMK